MKTFLEKIKSKKILLSLISLSLLSLFYILYTVNKQPPATIQKPINVYPPDNSKPLLMFPTTAIVFTFKKPISSELYRIKIDPPINIRSKVSENGLNLIISPAQKWQTEIVHSITLIDTNNNEFSKTSFTFLDPFKHPELVDEHPPGGI